MPAFARTLEPLARICAKIARLLRLMRKKIARKAHRSLHFDLVYIWRKGVPPEPYTPNRRPSFQTEMLLLNEDGKFDDSTPVAGLASV
jgi:hypothetical protein